MKRSSRVSRYVLALSVAAALLLVVGCSENLPLAPLPPPAADSPPATAEVDFVTELNLPQAIQSDGPDQESVELARKWIKARRGGEIKAGRYKLKFPRNALSQDAEIIIYEMGSGIVGMQMINLEPHGTIFLRPVRLEIQLEGTTAEADPWSVHLVYLNEETGAWEKIPGRLSKDGDKLIAYLEHFSRYALAN